MNAPLDLAIPESRVLLYAPFFPAADSDRLFADLHAIRSNLPGVLSVNSGRS